MADVTDLQPDLFAAIADGDVERVQALVAAHPEAAAIRREDGVSAVLWARYQYELEVLDVLLAANPPLDVFEAAAIGHTEAVRAALARDPGLATAYAPDGFTALGLAAFFGHRDVAGLLIGAGAPINEPSRNLMHVAPLHSALAGRHEAIEPGAGGGTHFEIVIHEDALPVEVERERAVAFQAVEHVIEQRNQPLAEPAEREVPLAVPVRVGNDDDACQRRTSRWTSSGSSGSTRPTGTANPSPAASRRP